MDKIPSGGGGAPDGAFERFLTAAIATIITIMFSWRLLAEEEEASGARESSFGPKPLQFTVDRNANFQNKSQDKPKLVKPRLADLRDIDLSIDEGNVLLPRSTDERQIVHEDIVYDRHDPLQERAPEATHIADDSVSSISSADDSLTADTLTTWDEYKWEEETGQEESCVIKTKRTVRDFVTDNKSLNLPSPTERVELEPHSLSFGASPTNGSALSPSVPFSQRFANFEYKDPGGDSGYIDLYPDVESDDDTDSSDDEHVYEIQVSDSDSDSDGDRGGGFFGVTALDTIMEEYESDVSDKGEGGSCDLEQREGSKSLDTNSNVKTQSSAPESVIKMSQNSENVSNTDYLTDRVAESTVLPNKIEINAKCQSQQNETQLRSTEADEPECNLSPDKSYTKDIKLTMHNTSQSTGTPTNTACDLNINTAQIGDRDTLNIDESEKITADRNSITSEEKINKNIQDKTEDVPLKLKDDEYKISEISDDSLPSSPIRTCALDNLMEEPFSDTESCSSESVITVLSVKSNDSDNYTDRSSNPRNLHNNLPDINIDPASGDLLSSAGNETITDGHSKYESFSLVSGFLNDSLNSLLSANTGSIENDSDPDSGKDHLEHESENQSENVNGKIGSDGSYVSSAESLPAVDEIVQVNAHISENGHIDSTDSLNTEHQQNLNSQNENDEHNSHPDSDNSSDSSDPPLREYDPDDDDLAAFQFNLDSDDDSFFLVIADDENDVDEDGRLRNFQTFTNLNSVGLSPEYGDAVTSHTLSDDARGFRFSHTEDVSTQFKTRSYFTERSNFSDSDTRSDGPLSPITSEDEEIKPEVVTEESVAADDNPETNALPSKPQNFTAYQDAEISSAHESESDKTSKSDTIDFKKYIINSDLSPIAESRSFPEEEISGVSEDAQIDKDDLMTDIDQKFVINSPGDKSGSLSVNEMNNLQDSDGQDETLSSLTEKIELLTQKSAEYFVKNEPEDLKEDENRNQFGVTDKIDRERTDTHATDDTVRDIKTQPRETLIDDVVTENELHGRQNSVERKRSVETNIDDLFESPNENVSKSNVKKETNIDDIFNDVSVVSKEQVSRENVHRSFATPIKAKKETNIDDLFTEDFRAPVHSTPLKSEWRSSRETNIDDIISDQNNQIDRDSEQKRKHNTKLETSIDDVIGEINDNRKTSTLKDKKHSEQVQKRSDSQGTSSLSYETFVDDLFETQLSRESSHAHTDARSSDSAIYVQKSPDQHLPADKTRGVQAVNTREQINVTGNNTHSNAIEDNINKANDPKQTDIVHAEQIGKEDTDFDPTLDKILSETVDNKLNTEPPRYEITTNYQNIYKEPEKSNRNNKYNKDRVDNEVSNRKSNENIPGQKQEKYSNVTEWIENISSPSECELDNRESLQSNLQTHELDFKQNNVRNSLPNSEALNNVKQNTNVGHSPDSGDRYNNPQTDSSLLSEPRKPSSLNTADDSSLIGLQIDDQLLKSEEECEVSDVELKIVENTDGDKHGQDLVNDDNYDSLGSCSIVSDNSSVVSLDGSYSSLQDSYSSARLRGLSDSEIASRIIRTPATKPSDIFSKPKDLKGIKKKVFRHNLKKYTSILQRPVTPERVNVSFDSAHRPPSVSRLRVAKSREKFLSAENLSNGTFEDKFLQHRTSLVSTPRKYLKRHETHLQSTESLPSDMMAWNTSYGSHTSMEKLHSLPSPRYIEELYGSRYSSANSSYEKSDYDKLHANCMFSPGKREEIRHTRASLENMFEQLLRYGSVSSLATETDIDATDHVNAQGQPLYDDYYVSFQYPLSRAASMSAITEQSESQRLPRKPGGKGRFANRKVPKSKSLQTLETNLDDVFTDDSIEPGKLSRTPSEHELRVSKSLSKLHVPDWFRKSSFSRSGSTQSLFNYATRTGSTSTLGSSIYPPSLTTSPCPSVTPGSNAVIIQKRVTPTNTASPSARLLRAPMLPTTPEKAPIHNTPLSLPSDRFRKQDKKDSSLKPIAIVPFAKLREMFEKKSIDDAKTKSPVTSPTKEKPPTKVRFETMSPSKETVIDDSISDNKPVQTVNDRTISPTPPVPERKPILTDHSVKHSDSNVQPRRTQVHFSDENHVSRSQEQNTNTLRQNGTAANKSSSTSAGTVKKPQSFRASLPLPQFRFRRPGSYARQAAAASGANQSSSQSKKGKIEHLTSDDINISRSVTSPQWLHALQVKTKTDGETLFEFLQKRRYSSILENGFAEQLDDLHDKSFTFPVMTLGRHSNQTGDLDLNGSPDLQVILTNAHLDNVSNGYLQNKLQSDASADEILDGLLLLDGHRTGRMRLDENGRIVPRTPDAWTLSPDTPPGLTVRVSPHEYDPRVCDDNNVYSDDNYMDYTLVKCEYPECKRETNLREAKQFFKTCHCCFTYYCSRNCRKQHWKLHKQACVYSRINSACKHVITYINKHSHLQYQCSRIARRGYLSQGRGCVVFAFPDISSSEDFLIYGMESLWVPPVYVSLKELPHATMLGSKLGILTDTCKQYNPELKYVIHIAIVIPPQLPVRPVPRRMESIIQKCAKLRLSPAHMHPKQEDTDIPSTLILTAVPGNQHLNESDDRKTRELCFVNIQRKLRNRGVSLRHQFPEIYNKLIDFVSDAKHFSPLIIYPSDNRTGKKFMCVIMPEAESEIEWIRDPDLFHELDVFDDVMELSTPNLSINQQPEIML